MTKTTKTKKWGNRAHRGVSLFQLSDGTHVARWTDPATGKPKQQSLRKLATKAERAQWAKAKAEEIGKHGRMIEAGVMERGRTGLDDVVERFLARPQLTKVSVLSQRAPADLFVQVMQRLGVDDMQSVAALHLRAFRDHVDTLGLMPSTRNRYLGTVKKLLAWAVAEGLNSGDSLGMVGGRDGILSRLRESSDIGFLRAKQVQQLLQSCLAHDATPSGTDRYDAVPVVLLALFTGLRSDELRGLQWSEVDLDDQTIYLPRERTKGKRASRDIDLSFCPGAIELLQALKARSLGSRFVFPDSRKGVRGYMSKSAIAALVDRLRTDFGAPDASGGNFSIKACRATCDSVLFNWRACPLTPKQVCERQGHTLQVAERSYIGRFKPVDPDAATFEAALGIEELVGQCIATVSGKVAKRATQARRVG